MSDITQEQFDASMVVLKSDSSNILNSKLTKFFEVKEFAIEAIETERQQHIKRIEELEGALREVADLLQKDGLAYYLANQALSTNEDKAYAAKMEDK